MYLRRIARFHKLIAKGLTKSAAIASFQKKAEDNISLFAK